MFLQSLATNPESGRSYGARVRALCCCWAVPEDCATQIVRLCMNLKHLAFWCEYADPNSRLFPILEMLSHPLQTLSTHRDRLQCPAAELSAAKPELDLTHPALANISFLEVVSLAGTWEDWSWDNLDRLTHLKYLFVDTMESSLEADFLCLALEKVISQRSFVRECLLVTMREFDAEEIALGVISRTIDNQGRPRIMNYLHNSAKTRVWRSYTIGLWGEDSIGRPLRS